MLLASLAACSAQPPAPATSPAPATFTATGTVDVPLDLQGALKIAKSPSQGQPCHAKSSWSDVENGRVRILDDGGKTVALGDFDGGTLQPQSDENTMILFARCRLSFTVPDVPVGKFFSVQVGDSSRDVKDFSRQELEDGIAISLADKAEMAS